MNRKAQEEQKKGWDEMQNGAAVKTPFGLRKMKNGEVQYRRNRKNGQIQEVKQMGMLHVKTTFA